MGDGSWMEMAQVFSKITNLSLEPLSSQKISKGVYLIGSTSPGDIPRAPAKK